MLDRVGGEVATASAGSGSHGAESGAPPHDLLSWSRYTTVMNCLRAYYYKYILGVPQRPQGAQLGGKTVHQLIEDYERDGVRQESAASYIEVDWPVRWVQVLDEAGGREAIRWSGRTTKEYPNGEDADWWFKQGPRMLDNYFWLREQDEAIGRKLMQGPNGPVIEARVLMEFGGVGSLDPSVGPDQLRSAPGGVGPDNPQKKAHLAPPILWQGYLDALHVDDEGPLVTDFKSGARGTPTSVFQLASYAVGWERTTGEIVERGRVVNLRQRKTPEMIDLRPAKALIEPIYRDLAQTIELHRGSGVWPASPSALCRGCSVLAYCVEGQILYPEEA